MTDTTDLLVDGASAPLGQDAPTTTAPAVAPGSVAPAAPRTRRRATSGGLAAMVLPELQALAGELGLSGLGRLRKSQLIEAIQAKQNGAASPAAAPAAATSTGLTGAAPAGAAPSARPARATRTPRAAAAPSTETADVAAATDVVADAPSADTDGERPERIDRGRERFLEREARRQERMASQGGDGGADGGTDGAAFVRQDRQDRQDRDRPARQDRTPQDRQDRTPQDRQDRTPQDRQDRTPQDRQDRTPQDRQQDGQQDVHDDEDNRRGRFRERGRGRNRTGNRPDRYGQGEPDPIISDDDVLVPVGGILDILDNYGFVRTTGYLTGPSDVYVSLQQVRRYGLRRGDAVTGAVRQQREGERKDKYNALVRLDSVNGLDPAEAHDRPDFTKLTPLYPQDRLRLETEPGLLTTRVIDLVMPVGKGQRALIVSPPKAGKTMVMQAIANAITTNNPECHLMVVLVDERPEEVTDMQRSVKGEVIASTFDRPPQDHITVAELSIERAKRLVELGHDVVVLLDSITRLGRAYNLGAPASGRILTGGVDSAALYPPKRFLGAARNIENGGSLTIFATALVETGSAMDTVIFEEFKGTGNAELKLDRRLADKRIFPAIDVDASGTRKEEILLSPEELRIVLSLRRVLHALDSTASLELLLDKMKATRTNVEFLMQIQKTTVSE
ncbi:MAG: transcription termination factor Rho [Frankiales bacterium]|nr:transcription termination factor Rho [Frankiales bacterium]